ncbi:MAG TPA: serine/threonine-protein kinase [Gemmatimonadaceae bacterium]|nr:serine/threonine-protein kinase [Gemmatimonadaceae bacterium]
MSVDHWHQIKSIFVQALEVPVHERNAFVSSACADDEYLKGEVESLLAAATAADTIPEARAAIASAAGSLVAEQEATLRSALEKVLGHQYEIVRQLGRGGMGTVYLAKERALERFVAIKVLRPDLAIAEGHRERFRREARIAARLSHPGILSLHSFGEIDNLWYFVMSYVRGETLAERIQREGVLQWGEAHRIFLEVVAALETAHKNGVIHRDIKPANILLDAESGRAILADFGISKMTGLAESLTATGAIMGTPVFMSPEQLSGAPDIDERSDIYSLGSVVYLMLTGRPPFGESTTSSTIYRRLVDDATPADQIESSIPATLSAIVHKCLAREREDRWTNVTALKAALESLVNIDRMPDVVRDIRSFAPYALLWTAAFVGFAFFGAHSASERILLLVAAVIAPIGLTLHVYNTVGGEMHFSDIAQAAAFPPAWWTMWWPYSLRRPNDVWGRLPRMSKAIRIVISASVPALFLLILVREGVNVPAMPDSGMWVDVAEWALLAVAAIAVIIGLLWARRAGLPIDRSLHVLLGATLTSPRWEDARVKRLLAPASGKVRAPEGDTPSDYLRAIRATIALVAPGDGNLALRTTSTAELLVRTINERDLELQRVSREAGPEEESRLTVRLQSLEGAGASSQEAVELRQLVQHELELVRRMQTRREVLVDDRGRLMEMLKALWNVVRQASDDDSNLENRLELLCGKIETEIGAAA